MTDRLNYSTQAIEDVRRMQRLYPAAHEPNVDTVLDWLDAAVKFILPERGELLDLTAFDQRHADLLRLPYPVVAVEAPFPPRPDERLLGSQVPSTKRIAVYVEMSAVEMLSSFPGAERPDPESHGVMVVPIYYVDAQKCWEIGAAASYVPYDQAVYQLAAGPHNPASSALLEELGKSERSISKSAMRTFLVPLRHKILHAMRTAGQTDTQIKTILLGNTMDEQTMLVQLCTVLNCGNVEQADVPVPEKLARARAKSGKLPFYEYKMLVLSDSTGERERGGEALGGTVRGHLRRGHIRRLTNRTIWVRATLVNAGAETGFVDKDYDLRSSRRPQG